MGRANPASRFSGALKLPAALTAFLVDDLGLPTADDPAAEADVWLNAPHTLTELVEADAFDTVAGSPQTNWSTGFAVASPDGEQVSGMALAWLPQMCDSSLRLDDYESALTSLRPQSTDGTRLTLRVLREDTNGIPGVPLPTSPPWKSRWATLPIAGFVPNSGWTEPLSAGWASVA